MPTDVPPAVPGRGVAGLVAVLAVDGLIAARSNKNVAAAEKRATVVLQAEYQNCLAHAVKEGSGRPTKQDCDRQLPANRLKDCLAIAAQHQRTARRRLTAVGRAP